MFLKGKSALITGSTSGIGLAYAHALAAEGAQVMINGFGDAAEIEKERAALEAASGKALYDKADMTICLGKLTWPHQLVRILIAEQLYRAVTILSGHPYHRV